MSKQTGGSSVAAAEASFDDLEKELQNRIEGWVEDQVGFPPYWRAAVDKKLLARVVIFDDRDESFPRYVMEALHPVECQRGPADGADRVMVEKGQFFTMSQYAALPLDKYFDMEVLLHVRGARKLPGNEESGGVRRDLFDWRVMVSPESKKILAARSKEVTNAMRLARETRLKEKAAELGAGKEGVSEGTSQRQKVAALF